nr:MAG TPA: hypothetical protein [Caudoviricetes sp.]
MSSGCRRFIFRSLFKSVRHPRSRRSPKVARL